MKKINLLFFMASLLFSQAAIVKGQDQNARWCPGKNVIGHGYDVFGLYADNKSVKYELFDFSNYEVKQLADGADYKVPGLLDLNYINDKTYNMTEGRSLSQYASKLAQEAGLEYDGLFFSGSINSRFGKEKTSSTNNYFCTINDKARRWEVGFDPFVDNLREHLKPKVKDAIDKMDPTQLFDKIGTHFVAKAYLGGAMEFNLSETYSSASEITEMSTTVNARYKKVSGSSNTNYNSSNSSSKYNKNINIFAKGGNSQFVNKDIESNEQYNKWAETIPTEVVLVDFIKGSLVPVWDLAADATRKNILKKAFLDKVKNNPLPKGNASAILMGNQNFYIKNKANNQYWGVPGNFGGKGKGGKIGLASKTGSKQSSDRVIKVIPGQEGMVFLQPQHSEFVADITGGLKTPGAQLQLWGKGDGNKTQLFAMEEVSGEKHTYLLKNANSGLYLTAHNGRPISQERLAGRGGRSQMWIFEPANNANLGTISTNFIYSVQCVDGGLYWDFGGRNNGSQLQLWSMDHGADRYFRFENLGNDKKYFLIHPMNTNKVVDNGGGRSNNGNKIGMHDRNNSAAQLFAFEYGGTPNTYQIISKCANKPLDADAGQVNANGCKVQIYDNRHTKNQKWVIKKVAPVCANPRKLTGTYYIKEAHSNKYWDVAGDGPSINHNGARVQIWDQNGASDRKVKFIASGDHNWFLIQFQNGGRVADIKGGSKGNGGAVHLWNRHNGATQQFGMFSTGPTTFILVNKNSGKFLDTEGGNSSINSNGKAIHQWDGHWDKSQQWQLIDVRTNKPVNLIQAQ